MKKTAKKKAPTGPTTQVALRLQAERAALRRVESAQRSVRDLARKIQRAEVALESLRLTTARMLVVNDRDYGVFGRGYVGDLERARDEAVRVAEELAGELQQLRDMPRPATV